MKDTILITGCAGFIASHIADRLRTSHNLVGIDNMSGGNPYNVPVVVDLHEEDCCNAKAMDDIFHDYKPRYVIHCAAMAAENLSHNCRRHTYLNNLVGEATVRNAAIKYGAECMLSMSSIAVMGHQDPPFFEAMVPCPADPYGVSKFAGEMDAKTAKDFFGLNYVILRPHNVIGVRQNMADRYRNVAAIFIRAIVENRPLPVFGDGLQTRQFTPVSYVADVAVAAINNKDCWNRVYNVGYDEAMTIMDLKRLLDGLMNKELPVEHLEARQEAVHALMRHERVRKCIPVEAQQTVRDVLAQMLEEAFAYPLPEMQKGPEIEITRNLPASWAQHA